MRDISATAFYLYSAAMAGFGVLGLFLTQTLVKAIKDLRRVNRILKEVNNERRLGSNPEGPGGGTTRI